MKTLSLELIMKAVKHALVDTQDTVGQQPMWNSQQIGVYGPAGPDDSPLVHITSPAAWSETVSNEASCD
jgi:hypothetical protein